MKDLKENSTALVILAIVVIMGMAMLLVFAKGTRETSSAQLNVTLGFTNATVAVGTTGQYPYLQTAVCTNNSAIPTSFNSTLYTVIENTVDGGLLRLDYVTGGQSDSFQGLLVDCDITYLKNTQASTAGASFITGLGYFGTFAGILAIALIGFAVIQLFSKKKGSKGEI